MRCNGTGAAIAPTAAAATVATVAVATRFVFLLAYLDAFHHTAVDGLAEQFLNRIDSLLIVT